MTIIQLNAITVLLIEDMLSGDEAGVEEDWSNEDVTAICKKQ